MPCLQPDDAMPINGLMVTLSSDPTLAADVCERIDGRAELEPGDRRDRWLPLVADTRDDREARELHRWLENLAGVDQVSVVLWGFDESNP